MCYLYVLYTDTYTYMCVYIEREVDIYKYVICLSHTHTYTHICIYMRERVIDI